MVFLLSGFKLESGLQKVDTNAKIKACFIYNFTKYIEWPTVDQSGEFLIGILGENASLYNQLDQMSKVKKVNNRSFSVATFGDLNSVEKVHILYIPAENTSLLQSAVKKFNKKKHFNSY